MHTPDLEKLSLVLQCNPLLAARLAAELKLLHRVRAYRQWTTSVEQALPFKIPAELLSSETMPVLCSTETELVRDGCLRLKINVIDGRVFLTDGTWISPDVRVFPFSDESEALLTFAQQRLVQESSAFDWVVDLASGCGHGGLAFECVKFRICLDINPRAIAMATINRCLNEIPAADTLLAVNDIRNGVPLPLHSLPGHGVVLANVPFSPTSAGTFALTTDGGRTGTDLQRATFDALKQLHHSRQLAGLPPLKAFLMSVTLGKRQDDGDDAAPESAHGHWEAVALAQEAFGAASVRWSLLRDERLMRANGTRTLSNPSRVAEALDTLGSCQLYTPEPAARQAKRARLAAQAASLEEQGLCDMAYGVIEVRF